jgi:hypothetical protein
MVTGVTSDNRDLLLAQGYGISELIGFEEHSIPLYTHKQLVDKGPGEVAIQARVGDMRQLNNAEANYLAHKASQGFFTWMPGEECLSHKFVDVSYEIDGLGRTVKTEAEPYYGCKWCRAAFKSESEELPVVSPPSTSEAPSAPAHKVKRYICEVCGKGYTRRDHFAGHMEEHSEPATDQALPEQPAGPHCKVCSWQPDHGEANVDAAVAVHYRSHAMRVAKAPEGGKINE